MKEIWKSIDGFNNYEVSNLGNVKNIKTDKILKKQLNNYYNVSLYDEDGKRYKKLVHRLVAIAFIPNPNNFPVVNHIDENKLNNEVNNLEWTTLQQNVLHSSKSHPDDMRYKKASKKIIQYDLEGNYIKLWNSVTEASNHLEITGSSISACLKGKSKTSRGFQWKYYCDNFPLKIESCKKDYIHKRIKIIQYDLDGNYINLWDSAKDIEESLKFKTSYKIIECCNKKLDNYKGYIWKYYYENFPKKIEVKHPKILQYDLNNNLLGIYNSIPEALIAIGGAKSEKMISNCCDGLREKAYGYIWKKEIL